MPRTNDDIYSIMIDYIESFEQGCTSSEIKDYVNGMLDTNYTRIQIAGRLNTFMRRCPNTIRKVRQWGHVCWQKV